MNQIKKIEKEMYISPCMKLIEIEPEGVLCCSGEIVGEDDLWGDSWGDDF